LVVRKPKANADYKLTNAGRTYKVEVLTDAVIHFEHGTLIRCDF
jgi:hypothetical protein